MLALPSPFGAKLYIFCYSNGYHSQQQPVEAEGPGAGRREKVVLSAGCFHQQQDAMLTTTVGLNNNTCRNIIFMPPDRGMEEEGVNGTGWGPNRFYDTHQALGLL